MRFVSDPALTRAECSSWSELQILENILTFDIGIVRGEDAGAESLLDDNTFYTGLVPYVCSKLDEEGVTYTVENLSDDQYKRLAVPEVLSTLTPDILPGIVLRDYQEGAVLRLVHNQRGIVKLPTGSGKTEIVQAALRYLIDRQQVSKAAFFVESKNIFNQSVRRFKKRGFSVGTYTSEGLDDPQAEVTVIMTPSVYSHMKTGRVEGMEDYDAFVYDECHHAASHRNAIVLSECSAPYRFGISATPFTSMGDPALARDFKLVGLIGNMVYEVPATYLIERGHIALPVAVFLDVREPPRFWHPDWHEAYKQGVVRNQYFHRLVAHTSVAMARLKHKVLILVFEIEHGLSILRALKEGHGWEASMFAGEETLHYWEDGELRERTESLGDVAKLFDNHEDSYILVGTPALGEGVDLPTVSVVLPVFGGKNYKRTLQAVGRGMRPKKGENVVFVIDFNHLSHPYLVSHARKRRSTYSSMGYVVVDGLGSLSHWDINIEPMG
jgi:superfamily II DNA or RNA helicase